MGHPPGVRTLTARAAGSPRRPRELPVPPELDASIALLRHGESVFIAENRFQGQHDTPLTPFGVHSGVLGNWLFALFDLVVGLGLLAFERSRLAIG